MRAWKCCRYHDERSSTRALSVTNNLYSLFAFLVIVQVKYGLLHIFNARNRRIFKRSVGFALDDDQTAAQDLQLVCRCRLHLV